MNTENREFWIVKNISSYKLTFGDLPKVPSIKPGEIENLLKYATKEEIGQSKVLIYYTKNKLIEFNKIIDDTSLICPSDYISKSITSVEEDEMEYKSTNYYTKSETYTKNEVNQLIGQSSSNLLIVRKNPLSGQFSSVYDAIKSISDASSTNRYTIKIESGIYAEKELEVPSYVYINGENLGGTIIVPDGEHHIFIMSNMTSLSDLTISGRNISGKAAVKIDNCGNFIVLSNLFISGCDYGIYYTVSDTDSYFFTRNLAFTDITSSCIKLESTNNKICYINSIDTVVTITENSTNTLNAIDLSGDTTQMILQVASFEGIDNTGNAIKISNGAKINNSSTRFAYWDKAIYVDDIGENPNVVIEIPDFFENNDNIYIENETCYGFSSGLSEYYKNTIPLESPFYIEGQDPNVITVGHKGCNFTSIKEAIDSITDNRNDNRYLIQVAAGLYEEDSITLKQYVVIQGVAEQSTIISLKENPTSPWLFDNNNQRACGINYLVFTNILKDQCVIKYRGNALKIDHCRFRDEVNLCVDARGIIGNSYNYCIIDNCTSASSSSYIKLFQMSNSSALYDSLLSISNFTTLSPIKSIGDVGTPYENYTGVKCRVQIQNCRFIGDGTDNGISVSDGAFIQIMGSDIQGFTKGFYTENNGDGPSMTIIGSVFDSNSDKNIDINHPLTTGTLNCITEISKVNINDTASQNISSLIQDKNEGSTLMSAGIHIGENPSIATDFTNAFSHGYPAGLISGGELSVKSGLTLTVAEGNGYLYPSAPEDSFIKDISWQSKDITVGANKSLIIYIDANGDLNSSESTPSFFSTIVVGRVVTLSSSVLFFSSSARNISAVSSKFEKIFRYYLGPIYRSGSTVSYSGLHLNVSEGNYCYSTSEYSPEGGTPISFSTWYRQGLWYTITENQIDVPNNKYDNGTGTLHDLDVGDYYVKHLLLVYGGEESESYFLVYGQQQFDSLSSAETGPIPIIPSPLGLNVTTLAAIIVKSGDTAISEIIDLRPTLVTRTSTGFSSTSDHNSLSNLTTGDPHTQYLPVDGSRPIEATMNLNKNNIINAGTIQVYGSSDSINISSHASRHVINGHDAFTFAAPVSNLSSTSTNYAGNTSSLNCSNHTHAIDAFSTNTAGLVKRDASGDFSARIITATLRGNSDTVTGFSGSSGKILTVQKSITLTSNDDTSIVTFPSGTSTLLSTSGSAANLTNWPTFNQNTTGTAYSVTGTNVVSNSNLSQMQAYTIKGNNLSGISNASDLTASQVVSILPSFIGDTGSGGVKGLVPAPSSGDSASNKFLKADGAWGIPIIVYYGHMYNSGSSQTVTVSNTGTFYRIPGNMISGLTYGTVFQNSRELLISNSGIYMISWSISATTVNTNETFAGTIMVDNIASNSSIASGSIFKVSQPQCISGYNILNITGGQIISLGVANLTAASDIIVYYANLSISKIS